jgi:hypothetical protein
VNVEKPVKTVFLSSVARGLEEYRDAVYREIERLDGYHCVRMEDFGARDLDSAKFCAQRAAACDIFVGLVGQRYGSSPPDDDRSFTEIEFDAAKAAGKSCLIFAAPEEFAVPANLIEPDNVRERLKAFRARVLDQPAGWFGGDEKDLALRVVEAFHNRRDELVSNRKIIQDQGRKTHLLFPYVTQAPGYDTGIAISNTGVDPLGTQGESGVCTLHYYGRMSNGSPAPSPQTSALVGPGQVCTYTLYNGSPQWLLDNRGSGFSGYMIVECNFPYAYAYAFMGDLGGGPGKAGVSTGYIATVIKPNRAGVAATKPHTPNCRK